MKLIVGINNIKIDEKDKLNAGEYNIHEVEFEFDEAYENLVKKAVFSEGKHNYLVSIENNKCTIPYEVLEKNGDINIGVYAYDVEDDELVLRYSPSPVYLYVNLGSYKDGYDNYEVPTPDTVEQMEAEINLKQDRLVSGTNIKTINNESILGEGNIDIQGGGTYTAGANIQISSENVISATDTIYDDTQVKQDITNLQNNKANISDIPDVSNFITKDVNNLTNYTLKTSTGSLIDLEVNSGTYVVTLYLKDIDGNVISTDSIDLPLESVVVSGSFDSTNKKIVLTLQNGNTIDIPVGDLVAGLQTEITSANKIASDLIDDNNSGNKFTNTSEKQTWNNKYDKPIAGIPKNDLASDVQISLSKADTAIQDISGKLDVSKVKTTNSTTRGDVYDVTYINSLVGDIDTALDLINGEVVS